MQKPNFISFLKHSSSYKIAIYDVKHLVKILYYILVYSSSLISTCHGRITISI